MKRIAAILFIAVLAFNLAGYRVFINWLQEKQTTAFAQKIDRGVNEAELISVKVPAALPYYANSKDFQWVDGEVTIEGMAYQYVKRRIYNDSIEFLCLQNAGKTRLQNARDQFFSLAYSLQTGKEKGNALPQVKPLLLEYYDTYKTVSLKSPEPPGSPIFKTRHSLLPHEIFIRTPEQPPEADA